MISAIGYFCLRFYVLVIYAAEILKDLNAVHFCRFIFQCFIVVA